MDSLKSETSIDLSSSTVGSQQTTPSPEETETTNESSMSLREALSAALNQNDEDAPAESVPDAETTGEQVVAESEAEGTQPEPLNAPEHWPAAERERFAALPRETQEWLLNRNKSFESDVGKRLQELSSQRKEVEEFNRLFEPYKQQMELSGRTPAQVVQQLLAAQRYLESSPADAIKWLAQSYNLNLNSIVEPQTQEYVDPQIAALQREIQQLKQHTLSQQQAQQTTEQQRVTQLVTEFKDSRTPDGQLKYPHFEDLKGFMAPLVAQGKSLEDAYNEVKYVLPSERQRIADEAAKVARADALQKAEEARKAKAKEAKSASTIIRSRGVGESTVASKGSLRGDLEEAMKALTGRI